MDTIMYQPLTAYSATRSSNMPFWNEIVCGDSEKLLQLIPSDSVDLVITSPPYFQQREYDGGGIGNEKKPATIFLC